VVGKGRAVDEPVEEVFVSLQDAAFACVAAQDGEDLPFSHSSLSPPFRFAKVITSSSPTLGLPRFLNCFNVSLNVGSRPSSMVIATSPRSSFSTILTLPFNSTLIRPTPSNQSILSSLSLRRNLS